MDRHPAALLSRGHAAASKPVRLLHRHITPGSCCARARPHGAGPPQAARAPQGETDLVALAPPKASSAQGWAAEVLPPTRHQRPLAAALLQALSREGTLAAPRLSRRLGQRLLLQRAALLALHSLETLSRHHQRCGGQLSQHAAAGVLRGEPVGWVLCQSHDALKFRPRASCCPTQLAVTLSKNVCGWIPGGSVQPWRRPCLGAAAFS